ncbi:gamma-glutamylcyclotransferase family protein [Catenovulum sp. SX2]|uniref:gamma-glutamylcyclotransferase family protein n=1 Tax=Catenovulum sp. SX2 TaxID=3398614 RepID=UPI003F8497AE
MANIFTYGSLMYEPVWQKLVRGHYKKVPAQLDKFKRVKVKQASYPVIIEDADHSVNGMVYFDVTPEDVQLLDIFEGDYYQRTSLTVASESGELVVDCYLLNPQHHNICSSELWCEQEFIDKYLINFVDDYLAEKNNESI